MSTLEDVRHNFEDGDYVTFREVKGMIELNDCLPRKIKVISEYFLMSDIVSALQTVRGLAY